MAGTIFYRERRKVGEQDRQPRFRVVAVAGAEIHFFATHLRLQELESMAQAVGATLVALPAGEGHEGGHGGRRGCGGHRGGTPCS
ncbi:MAG TPA: hypothetical protein PK393_02195 [Synergistaceae bacterium]|nr:hypothetical protein [Synergistaceae bacterium]HQF91324.1 hypothetical protein [Synergistaceae bacterium]HQH78041.1 hypothetical protein [Synergistaceae bacterium]HQK24319.1 hypothetical protein [Synergistaceae bacterium]